MARLCGWRRYASAAAGAALLGCSATAQRIEERLPSGLDDSGRYYRIYFKDQDYAQFPFFVVDTGWSSVARARLEGLLAELRKMEEFRALLDERQRGILDRVDLRVVNTDRVVWGSNVVGGREQIAVSYGSVWFAQQFAANMWNMFSFKDYRFVSLLLLSEKGLELEKSRRWFAAKPYLTYRGYVVPSTPPSGFNDIWENVQVHMALTGLVHELCHLFDETAGPARAAKLSRIPADQRLSTERFWEVQADRCAARLISDAGGNPEAGLAMVLAVATVSHDPVNSSHPATSERVAHLRQLGDAAAARVVEDEGVSRAVAEEYRDLIRRLGAIYAHVYEQPV